MDSILHWLTIGASAGVLFVGFFGVIILAGIALVLLLQFMDFM